jgi:GxxExxY protein
LVEEALTHSAIGAFFEVYNTLGFGFLEIVYEMALERELSERSHQVAREVWVPVIYKGHELCKQRLDMIRFVGPGPPLASRTEGSLTDDSD